MRAEVGATLRAFGLRRNQLAQVAARARHRERKEAIRQKLDAQAIVQLREEVRMLAVENIDLRAACDFHRSLAESWASHAKKSDAELYALRSLVNRDGRGDTEEHF